jgi:hypothetical protein
VADIDLERKMAQRTPEPSDYFSVGIGDSKNSAAVAAFSIENPRQETRVGTVRIFV